MQDVGQFSGTGAVVCDNTAEHPAANNAGKAATERGGRKEGGSFQVTAVV
jgi:hypothetical protein